ncbi:unnamed protein product [Coffea canephora]|uniref:Uncharacterized protein n=1 Tax=Coffea canephora TaxID=49390 RepID=A0A068USE0_COFCA|nr:unnamed protein product [Coffea canephora]
MFLGFQNIHGYWKFFSSFIVITRGHKRHLVFSILVKKFSIFNDCYKKKISKNANSLIIQIEW